MTLVFLSLERQKMYAHAEQTYPYECCGLLLGKTECVAGQLQTTIAEVRPLENVWDRSDAPEIFREARDFDPGRERRYTIAPEDLLEAQKAARDRGWAIVGIYHSHPNGPAVPSETDRRYAWREYAYAILSVRDGKVAEVRSWKLDDRGNFGEQALG